MGKGTKRGRGRKGNIGTWDGEERGRITVPWSRRGSGEFRRSEKFRKDGVKLGKRLRRR